MFLTTKNTLFVFYQNYLYIIKQITFPNMLNTTKHSSYKYIISELENPTTIHHKIISMIFMMQSYLTFFKRATAST